MRKRFAFILFSTFILLLVAACSKDTVSPEEQLQAYIDHWITEDFSAMHEMLSEESQADYPKDEFTERYEKVYTDMNIEDIHVTFEPLTTDEIKSAVENNEATIPFSASMTSLAGPISFDYEAQLQLVGDENNEGWVIEWNPGLIFPPLNDGGKIAFRSETPDRGDILDRDSIPLAMNDIVYEVGIVPERLPADPSAELATIAAILEMSVSSIEDALAADWVEPHLYVPITKVVKTKEDVLTQLWDIPSIDRREVTGRVYPLEEAAAHLIGFVGQITAEELESAEPGTYGSQDIIGKRGLELIFEDTLKGERGVTIVVEKDGEDDVILAEKPVEHGEDVQLTILSFVQKEMYESYDGEAGTSAAIHPKTGETLALVSSPSFNPHDFAYGISQQKREELEQDEQQPLLNRFTATFAPGSVMKPISAAIGMKDGTLDPNEGFEINGLTWDNGWDDYQIRRVSTSNKPVDLADALIRSDNIYFAMQSINMGIDAYSEGLVNFGFEEPFPYPYPFTSSSMAASGAIDNEVLLANSSYGQGELEMSALHLAVSYTPFLNEGSMIQPVLLTSEETEEFWKEDLLSKEDAALVQDILHKVVTEGTASQAQREELEISGKTGTAELKLSIDSTGHNNGWFVGYPTESQDVIIAMMVEKVEDIGSSGFVANKVADLLVEITLE